MEKKRTFGESLSKISKAGKFEKPTITSEKNKEPGMGENIDLGNGETLFIIHGPGRHDPILEEVKRRGLKWESEQ